MNERRTRAIGKAFVGATLACLVGLAATTGAIAKDTSVKITDFKFTAKSVTVTVGSVVSWTNGATRNHTVTADGGTFDSGQIGPGEAFGNLFDAPGTFAYHCSIHPDQMKGTIIVKAAAPTPSHAGTPEPTPPAGTLPPGFRSPGVTGKPAAAIVEPPATPGPDDAIKAGSTYLPLLVVVAVAATIVMLFVFPNRRRKPPTR